jgi:hypothetical protein
MRFAGADKKVLITHQQASAPSISKSALSISTFHQQNQHSLQTLTQTINQMPKIRPLQGDQLPIDELIPDAPKTIALKPIKKPFKISPLYRSKKINA